MTCPQCAGPVDPDTGQCTEHRALLEYAARAAAEAIDRYNSEQAALAGRPIPFWKPRCDDATNQR